MFAGVERGGKNTLMITTSTIERETRDRQTEQGFHAVEGEKRGSYPIRQFSCNYCIIQANKKKGPFVRRSRRKTQGGDRVWKWKWKGKGNPIVAMRSVDTVACPVFSLNCDRE